MESKALVEKVQASSAFKTWHKDHKDFVLTSVFNVAEKGWTLGYYSKKKDEMVTFDTHPIKKHPPDQVFKKEDDIHALDIQQVKVSLAEIDQKVAALLKEKYRMHTPSKKIIILQHQETTVYNITIITTTFNVINIRINAMNGDVISETITSALNFQER